MGIKGGHSTFCGIRPFPAHTVQLQVKYALILNIKEDFMLVREGNRHQFKYIQCDTVLLTIPGRDSHT